MDVKMFGRNMRDFVNSDQFHRYAKIGTEVCGHLIDYGKRPSITSAMRVGLSVIGLVAEERNARWSDAYFPSQTWCGMYHVYDRNITPIIFEAFKGEAKCTQTAKTADEEVIKKFMFGDLEVGFLLESGNRGARMMYARLSDLERLESVVSEVLCRHCKSKSLVMHTVTQDDSIGIEADQNDGIMMSEVAQVNYANIKRFIDAGFNRSLMLYGLPGTGKSTLARAIISQFDDFKTLRIKVEDLQNVSTTTIIHIVKALKPGAVLLDDFDRSGDQRRLLELMEQLKQTVKLVIATVNDRDRLDEAIMRPGRFDDLVEVNQLDEAIVKHVLGKFAEDYDIVKDWPIAFITEYVIRRQIMGVEETQESIKGLIARIERLKSNPFSEDVRWKALLKNTLKIDQKDDD